MYRANFEFVWRTLRALGVTASAVDDAAQDVFVVVHRRLREFEGRASVNTWLYEIARRVALRYRSRAANDAARTFELPDLQASDDLDAAVDQAIAAEVLRAFIATLDEDRRRVFVLAEFGEMRGREIAEALHVNVNTVYARLRSARTELSRMARRLQSKDAAALTRAMRATRPPAGARERTWSAVIGAVGGQTALTTGTAMTTSFATGLAKWIAVGSVAGVVGITTFALLGGSSAPASPGSRPSDSSRARDPPALASAVSQQPSPPAAASNGPADIVGVVQGRDRSRRVIRQPSPQPTQPSLQDQLERARAVRDAVRAADETKARTAIDSYRREFPDGALRLEVDALEVELACRLSADDAAQQLHALSRQRPDSHLVHRLERVCARTIAPRKHTDARTQ